MDRSLAVGSWREKYENGTNRHVTFLSTTMSARGARLQAPDILRSFQLGSHLLRWITACSLLGNNELVRFAV